MSINSRTDCYEIVNGLDDALTSKGIDDYYVVGGMASKPLIDGDFTLDHEDKTIVAGPELSLPVLRDNGSVRDIDVLVFTDDKTRIQTARHTVEEVIADELKISVFGVERHEKLTNTAGRLGRLFTDFLSHRTVDADGVHRYVLGSIEETVPVETYEPWSLITPGGQKLQVMHPVAQIDCYDMRSLSGSRAKDSDKINQTRQNVFDDPKMVEDSEELYGSWESFIQKRDSLLWLANDQLGPSFVASLHATKGRVLRFLENNETIVNLAQHPAVQKILNFAVRSA